MALLTEEFVQGIISCNEIYAAGSLIKVVALADCAQEPVTRTITNTIAGTIGDETLTLTADVDNVWLEQGTILYFSADGSLPANEEVVVTQTTEVGTVAVPVPVEPLTTALALNDVALTWGALSILSPKAIPLASTSETVDRTDLSFGLQSAEVKTAVGLDIALNLVSRTDDRAFWSIVHPADQGTQDVYIIAVSGAEHAIGRAKVMNLNSPADIKTIIEPTVDLMFQPPFGRVAPYEYLSTAQQTNLNLIRQYAGLSQLA